MASLNGAAAVVRDALGSLRVDDMQPEQLALLGEAALPAGRRIEQRDIARAAAAERRAGRPPGATNLATRELRRALHASGLDAVWEMARWARLTPEELAERLGCTRLEAFDRLQALRREVARYQHAPMAATDDRGNVVPTMVMAVGGVVATPGNARPPWEWDRDGTFIEVEQNQQVSEGEADRSKGDVSKAEGKA